MNHDCPNNKAAVVNGEYRTGCNQCLNTRQQSSDYANKYRRDRMRENGRKDMLQRYDGEEINPEWVKAHEDKAIEAYGAAEVERILRK